MSERFQLRSSGKIPDRTCTAGDKKCHHATLRGEPDTPGDVEQNCLPREHSHLVPSEDKPHLDYEEDRDPLVVAVVELGINMSVTVAVSLDIEGEISLDLRSKLTTKVSGTWNSEYM